MRRQPMTKPVRLLTGTLDVLVLRAVSLGRLSGYAVLHRIAHISGGVLQVQQGALYPALARLERRGLLVCEWGTSAAGRRAKYYELTVAGSRQLHVGSAELRRHAAALIQSLQTCSVDPD